MFFGGTGGAADAVTAGAAAKHDDDIAGLRALATDVILRGSTHHRADFQTLGTVVLMVELTYVRGGQSNLIAVGRVTGSGTLGDDRLRQLALDSLADGRIDVTRTRHAQCLIHIATAAQRVADGTAHTGGSTAKRLYLSRMVVGLILVHQQPRFLLAVHLHRDADAAGVVLFRNLHIGQMTGLTFGLGIDRGHIHQRLRFHPIAINLFS